MKETYSQRAEGREKTCVMHRQTDRQIDRQTDRGDSLSV